MLRSPGTLSFLDPLGPPMEQRRGANQIRSALQCGTPGELRLFQLLDRDKMAVDQCCVGQRPQMLRWLQLGRERWQEEQMEVLGHPELEAGMPACPVKNQDDLLLRTRSDGPSKRLQFDGKQVQIHAGRQMEDGLSRSRMHETDQITPVVAVLDRGNGRSLSKHQTFCRIGLSPMRCSSMVHSSTCAFGKAVATAWTSGRIFF